MRAAALGLVVVPVVLVVAANRAHAGGVEPATTTTTTATPATTTRKCELPLPDSLTGCQGPGGGAQAGPPGGGPLAGAVGAAFGPVMEAGTAVALRAVTGWVADSAAWLLGELGHLLDDRSSATRPQLGAGGWFDGRYRVMARLAGWMAGPILLLAVAQAIVRQDFGGLLRSTFVHLPLAGLLTLIAVKAVDTGMALTDLLSSDVAGSASAGAHKALSSVAAMVVQGSLGSGSGPMFLALVIGAVVVLAALVLWVELVLRAAAIYVAVLFLPMALAAFIWPATAHWARRLAETLAALLLAKFVVVGVLALGFSALEAGALSRSGGHVGALLMGVSLLLLATSAPWVLLRLIPMAEAGALAHMEGVSRRVVGTTGRSAWSAVRRATAPASDGGAQVLATTPRMEPAPGVRPAIVTPYTGSQQSAAPAAEGGPLMGDREGEKADLRRHEREDPYRDVHFPGRPSFEAALAQLGGLEVSASEKPPRRDNGPDGAGR